MKRYYLPLIIIGIIIFAASVFFLLRISRKQISPIPYPDVIDDSLRLIRKNISINRDSNIYWHEQYQIYLAKKDSVDHLDSLAWGWLRDSLSAKVKSDVRESLRERTP